MSDAKIKPFDSFSVVHKILIYAGFYKLMNEPKSRFKRTCYQIYRGFALMVVIWFNITHIIFMVQRRHNLDDVFDSFVIELPQLNLIMKYLTFNLHMPRIGKINKLINDPIFAAYSDKDKELLQETTRNMHRLAKMMTISCSLTGFFWLMSLLVRKYQNPTSVIASYVPFESDTWVKYSLAVVLEVTPLIWVGYGHLALDCVVATYYAQAEVQLKIIKYNLEHLLDGAGGDLYRDVADKDLRSRFVHYVQRYEAVAWYTKEIGQVFNGSLSFAVFSSTATICAITYRLSSIPVMSVTFAFLFGFLTIVMLQVFLYCYLGNSVQYESDTVMVSLYLSDWMSASPQLRRLLLIAMLRWSRPLSPRISGVVPLSLDTFVMILRSAYSLFAVLTTKQ